MTRHDDADILDVDPTLDPGLLAGVEGLDEILASITAPAEGRPAEGRGDGEPGDAPCAAAGGDPGDGSDNDAGDGGAARPANLLIDADACPVTREALAEARRAGTHTVIAGNTTQNLERHVRPDDPRTPCDARRRPDGTPGFWVETLTASVGADSADFAIVERLRPGDVVVTQDIGLAGMCLGRGASAIGVRGRIYDRATIDAQLLIRHEEKRERRRGGRTKGPSAFTEQDRRRFVRNLRRLLDGSAHS